MAFDPISREFYIPEALIKDCISCKIPFSTFRRRHHCKYCGGVFCSVCTQNRFQTENGLWVDKVCVKCFTYLSKPLSDAPKQKKLSLNPNFLLSSDAIGSHQRNISDAGSSSKSTEDFNREQKVRELHEELHNKGDRENAFKLEEFMKARIIEVLSEHNVKNDWVGIVSKLLKECNTKVCSSVQFRSDEMDLNNYIGIKKFEYKDQTLCKYVHGVIFEGQSHCKILAKPILNPIILLLSKNATVNVGDKKTIPINEVIQEESETMKIFLGKIKSLEISIIITEGIFPQDLIDELLGVGIGSILNVKPKDLKIIARETQGCIISAVHCANTSIENLGRCQEYDEVQCGNAYFSVLKDVNANTLCGNILISGPDQVENQKVGMAIRRLIVEYRNSILERRALILCRVKPSPVIFEKTFISSAYFKRFITCGNKMCEKATIVKVELYSKEDLTLGSFLFNLASKAETHCSDPECKNMFGAHKIHYLRSNGKIEISMSRSKKNHHQDVIFVRECIICQTVDQPSVCVTKAL